MMPLTLFSVGLLFFLWLIVLASHYRAQYRRARRDRRCIEAIEALRSLFEVLPQHRGAANALLQGDESFRERLVALRGAVDASMGRIDRLMATDPAFRHRWERIGELWGALRGGVEGLSAEESFQRHTALITEVVYLIADVASEARLMERERHLCTLARLLFDGLFELMEFSGRARGIGAGVAARGKLGAAARVKLNYLHDNLVALADAAARGFEAIVPHHAGVARHQALVGEGVASARDFAGLIEKELLEPREITIDPDRYFEAGSGAIQTNLKLFDTLLPLVVAESEARRRREQRRLSLMIAATAVVLVAITAIELA